MLHTSRARVLLKARPTPEQLRDRVSEPIPDGLELYLDVRDIEPDDWLTTLQQRIAALDLPDDFDWVVEGPLRSLDGEFFDVSRDTAANREVLRRIVTGGREIGARAAVIHAIAVMDNRTEVSDVLREATLRASEPLLRYYADLCTRNGLVPTIENVPPVLKMREARFMQSPIGLEPDDLIALTSAAEGLMVTLDVSHAQLYLNAVRLDARDAPQEVASFVAWLAGRRQVSTLDEYIDRIAPLLYEAHFSNARGLLGEGLAWDDGDLDLDRLTARLGRIARYLVTETIEGDPDRAVFMREAQQRMMSVLAGAGALARQAGS